MVYQNWLRKKVKKKKDKTQLGMEDQEEQSLMPKYVKCDELMTEAYRKYQPKFTLIQSEGIEPWPYPNT